jgi:hypothetical protein
MTKEEARKLLEGTWSFTASGSNVLVRDAGLLQEIELLAQAARRAAPARSLNSAAVQSTPVFALTG